MRIRIFSFSESSLADEWKADDATKDDISKTQELFRMVFASSSDWYYSFCYGDLLENDSYWHCAICKRCDKWRTWHCDKCNKCKRFSFVSKCGSNSTIYFVFPTGTYGQSLPCERCGRSSAESGDESHSSFFPFF